MLHLNMKTANSWFPLCLKKQRFLLVSGTPQPPKAKMSAGGPQRSRCLIKHNHRVFSAWKFLLPGHHSSKYLSPAPEQNIEQELAAQSPLASESFQQFFQGKKSAHPNDQLRFQASSHRPCEQHSRNLPQWELAVWLKDPDFNPQFTMPRCKYWLAVSLDKNALGVHLFLRQENWRNSTQPHFAKWRLLQLAEVHLNGPRWVNGCSGGLLQFPSAHEVSRLLIGHAHYASIVVATFPAGSFQSVMNPRIHESRKGQCSKSTTPASMLLKMSAISWIPKCRHPRTGELWPLWFCFLLLECLPTARNIYEEKPWLDGK